MRDEFRPMTVKCKQIFNALIGMSLICAVLLYFAAAPFLAQAATRPAAASPAAPIPSTATAIITTPTYLPVIARAGRRVYFVSPTGSDTQPGTLNQPWRTIQQAANTLQPGDTVYVREGLYPERVTINVSGSALGGYITLRNYPGETPILDGTGLSVPAAENGMLLLVDRQYLIIDGFEIRNYRTTVPERLPVGIHLRGAAHHIELRRNRIHAIETNAPVDDELLGADAHGIAVYGTAAAPISQLTIDGNELYDLKLGSSEALVLNGNVALFTITHNIIRDSDNIGLDLIGFEGTGPTPALDQARDGLVAGNTIYNIDTLANPAYGGERSAAGIYVDGGANIIIERNRVYDSNIGLELASEHQGRATSLITVRNNFVANNHIAGLAMGGYDTRRGSTENCVVVNNTFYNNDTSEDGNGEILIQFDTRSNVIKNNIIYANNEQSLLISNSYTQNSGNQVDYNLYFAPAGAGDSEWQWQGISYQGLAAYQAGSGNDAHSLFVEPALVNPPALDLHRQVASPAADRGENLPAAGPLDIDGDARRQGSAIDLGADERQ